MSDIKFIYWFSYYNLDSPSVRYRGKYPLEYFRDNYQIESSLIIPSYQPKKVFLFIKSFCSALFFRKKNSVIVIQRVHSNFIYSTLLKLLVAIRKKDTVYDLDDADYLYCKSKAIYYFAKKCSRITAGSKAIAEHLSPFNPNIRITTSPTPDLQIIKKNKNKLFTIGWIGGFGGDHKTSLIETVFPAIKNLEFPCKFILLGVTKEKDREFIQEYFRENENIQTETPEDIEWKNELAVQEQIVLFDIGIATLIDNEIQRSKSGIKAKQYLNNGIPVLATNLPENDWVVKPDINGFFCSNIQEFQQRIEEFHSMEEGQYLTFSGKARNSITAFNQQKYFVDFTTDC